MSSNNIFGQSVRMQQVLAKIEEAARGRTGVLITGERGTGRQMVARAIHERGRPDHAPFVLVSCAHIAPHELEHALLGCEVPLNPRPRHRFGHEMIMPGSLVHQAMGGTLYFTHLCELPDRIQARLARLFRDEEAIIGGKGRPTPLDIRPIAASGPTHTAELLDGRLRQDLHRRFSGFQIDLPPLRERREDVPALVRHFIDSTCRTATITPRLVTDSALAVLAALPWRENVRELQTVVDVLVLRARGASIDLDDVLEQVSLEGGQAQVPVGLKGTLREARAHFERDYISAVLDHHHGKIPDAARALGIQRTNLYRKLRTLRLIRPALQARARARA